MRNKANRMCLPGMVERGIDIFAGREYYSWGNMKVHEKERFMKYFCSDLSYLPLNIKTGSESF